MVDPTLPVPVPVPVPVPMEIITTEIFPKLPAKSLVKFKCLSKSFQTLISSPEFIHLQLRHTISSDTNRLLILLCNSADLHTLHLDSPGFPPVTLRFPLGEGYAGGLFPVGACNGLLCVAAPRSSLFLLNPSTAFFREVHCSYLSAGVHSLYSNYGFGFDDAHDDYKIVRIVAQYSYDDDVADGYAIKREVSVYSMKSDSWSLIERKSCQDSLKHLESGALVENHLVHWNCWHPLNNEHRIICFDLHNNQWSEDVALPDYGETDSGGKALHFADILFQTCRNKQNDLIHLGVLDGCLCLLTEKTQLSGVDVWVMKEYGVSESWVKLATILNKDINRPLKLCPFAYSRGSKREILIRADSQSRFIWYNIRDKTWRWAEMRGAPRYYGACVCKGSLVSIPRGIRFQIGAQQNQG